MAAGRVRAALATGFRALESSFRLLRPEFWVVSIFPGWIGWVLATRQVVPAQDHLLSVGGAGDFGGVIDWAFQNLEAFLTLLVLGPLLGGSIMITNDYFDRRVDVFNPKKTRSPLVAGTATEERAVALMVVLTAATIALGFAIRWELGVLMVAGEALSFAYSAPPLRIKARPLGDLAANAAGYGVITTTAGWLLGRGPGDPFPLGGLLVLVLAMAAITLPTIMMDRVPDAQSGLRTTAVVLGHRASWILGLECLLATNLLMAGLAGMGRYVAPSFIAVQLPFFLAQLGAFVALVREEVPSRIFLGAALIVVGLFANLACFVLVYSGLWRLA